MKCESKANAKMTIYHRLKHSRSRILAQHKWKVEFTSKIKGFPHRRNKIQNTIEAYFQVFRAKVTSQES